jgi:hypothetical protein
MERYIFYFFLHKGDLYSLISWLTENIELIQIPTSFILKNEKPHTFYPINMGFKGDTTSLILLITQNKEII